MRGTLESWILNPRWPEIFSYTFGYYSVIWLCTFTLEIYVNYFNVSPAYRRPISHFEDPVFLPSDGAELFGGVGEVF